jgi:hypothetical protein
VSHRGDAGMASLVYAAPRATALHERWTRKEIGDRAGAPLFTGTYPALPNSRKASSRTFRARIQPRPT